LFNWELVEPIFPADFATIGVLNTDPTVWLDGARPPPIKSNYDFNYVKV